MKIRQKVHSEEVGKIRYAESNDAYLARFKASESKAKEKGFSPPVNRT